MQHIIGLNITILGSIYNHPPKINISANVFPIFNLVNAIDRVMTTEKCRCDVFNYLEP